MHHLVFSAVRNRLRAQNLTARLQLPSALHTPGPAAAFTGSAADTAPWSLTSPPPPAPVLPFTAERPPFPPVTIAPFVPPISSLYQGEVGNGADRTAPAGGTPRTAPTAREVEKTHVQGGNGAAPAEPAKIIQLYDAYLVVETEAGMLVIDQHALHERILFEQLKHRIRGGPLETQRLLIPEPVELSAEQAARTLEQREALFELGLGVEDFGGGTVLLTSYPALLGRRPPAETLRAVVDHLVSKERLPSREVLLNDLLSLMACHAAVRAGDRLTPEAMASLVAQRNLADDTHHCPHGRPTALLFSRHDLERQFRRV